MLTAADLSLDAKGGQEEKDGRRKRDLGSHREKDGGLVGELGPSWTSCRA
jgi:hypothetical protein